MRLGTLWRVLHRRSQKNAFDLTLINEEAGGFLVIQKLIFPWKHFCAKNFAPLSFLRLQPIAANHSKITFLSFDNDIFRAPWSLVSDRRCKISAHASLLNLMKLVTHVLSLLSSLRSHTRKLSSIFSRSLKAFWMSCSAIVSHFSPFIIDELHRQWSSASRNVLEISGRRDKCIWLFSQLAVQNLCPCHSFSESEVWKRVKETRKLRVKNREAYRPFSACVLKLGNWTRVALRQLAFRVSCFNFLLHLP